MEQYNGSHLRVWLEGHPKSGKNVHTYMSD